MKRNFYRYLAYGYSLFCLLLWVGAILGLPITSFPLLVKLTPSSTVAPLTTIFMAVLGFVWLLPRLLRGGKLPVESKPLVWFALAAVVAWGASFFVDLPTFRGRSNLTEGLKAFTTFGLGLVAYFVPAAWLSADRKNLRGTFILINLVGAVLLAWCFFQAYFVIFNHGDYPFKVEQFQRLFSSRRGDPLIQSRVTGFAYEPSFLAHQLNLVFLPIWLAATLQGYSAHRKIFHISFENILLLGGLFSLYFSASRIGWLSFLLVLAYQLLVWNLKLAHYIHSSFSARFRIRPLWQKFTRVAIPAGLVTFFVLIYIALGFGMLQLGARFEPRLAKILKRDPFSATSFYAFTNELAFAERTVYWGTGLSIFADHPVLGVGLGNAGLYFPEKMPAYGYGLVEVNKLFSHWSNLPNIKSFWVRIPAETGLIGIGILIGWFYLLWHSTRLGRASRDPLIKCLALAGTFAWIAFLLEGFSIDSLALPYFWFAMALISAVRVSASTS